MLAAGPFLTVSLSGRDAHKITTGQILPSDERLVRPMEIQPGLGRLPGSSLWGIDPPEGSDLSQQAFAELPGSCGHSAAAPGSEVQRLQSQGMIRTIKPCGVGADLRSSGVDLAAR